MTQQGDHPNSGGSASTRTVRDVDVIGDARSLGLAAFAATTFAFGLSYTTIWSSGSSAAMAILLALVYGGAIQILAGIWAFARRQSFAAVALCSFGAFYVAYYEFNRSVVSGLSSADATTALEVFLLLWLIFSSYVFLAATRVSGVAAVTYFF